MECPKCQGEMKEIDSSEGVTLDFCGSCHGLWFDLGEVADYFELSVDIPDLDTTNATKTKTSLVCPKCKELLEELRYSALDRLLVDRCPGCGGIFLDKGEVPMLERLSARLESPKSRIVRTVKGLSSKGFHLLGITGK